MIALVLFLAALPAPTLADDMAREMKQPTTAPILANRHVVFVGGFSSELVFWFFVDNERAARALGAATTIITPPSLLPIDVNVEMLRRRILAIRKADKRPIVLAGHSKGGAEVLLFALRYPEFLLDGTIESVLSIQGALGGSPIADAFRGVIDLVPLGGGIPSRLRSRPHAMFRLALVDMHDRLSKDEVDRVSRKIYYVRSAQVPEKIPLLFRSTQIWMAKLHRRNDGVILTRDMKLDGIGTDLGVLDSDHTGLTIWFPGNGTEASRSAFTRAVLRRIHRSS